MTPGEVVTTMQAGALVADRLTTFLRCFAEREFHIAWVIQAGQHLRHALDQDPHTRSVAVRCNP